ncbi:MAG: glycosyltransferase family 4 protein [Chloroflexota bacterium]|nr:glycosyltransferase family 4 protein [Chloroflexota bacterium]
MADSDMDEGSDIKDQVLNEGSGTPKDQKLGFGSQISTPVPRLLTSRQEDKALTTNHQSPITNQQPLTTRSSTVWLLTDVFPPGGGGSGWSTFYLGRALRDAGWHVRVMRPRYDCSVVTPQVRVVEYGELNIEEILVPQPPWWLGKVDGSMARAYTGRTATRLLARRAYIHARRGDAQVLHGQHAISAVAASRAALRSRKDGLSVVSVGTVRDYWPLCPVSTRLFNSEGGDFECPECHKLSSYLQCATSRARKAYRLKKMPVSLARWAATRASAGELARCDAVIGVSRYITSELRGSGRIAGEKLRTIPNLVELPSVERAISGPWPLKDVPADVPFMLFAGKLDPNKGAQHLPAALREAGVDMPVVFAGDGPLKGQLQSEGARRGLDLRFYDWLDNDSVLRLMHSARVLLFPSAWQEPLSRVLLEGCASGAAIVALNTGGTGDVLEHMRSGWLAKDMADFADGVCRVASDDNLNVRLREGARRQAAERFAAPRVASEMSELYVDLLARHAT